MTHVYNKPEDFKSDVLRGFALAYPAYVERVADASGFVRAGGPTEGKVSLLVGGGSGHYPSYSGVVGVGFVDGAVLGDLFASPSAEQAYRVGRAVHGGAGLVIAFGNYAGDRLNFAVAADRLRADGIDTRVVYVTDDVASGPPDQPDLRRGIAGTFTVYKIAGAAAESGADLDEVERVMRAANAATFSFGVAFDGCTMPGADEPLFHVEPGSMDFGLGIHGEPGISSASWMPAHDLAAQLVEAVLAERPEGASGRAAVLLNGLGATKWEELFVLWGEVVTLLQDSGVHLVAPEVGELVTSLDMAGCSLSVTWLDPELEDYWTAPASTPSFHRSESVATQRSEPQVRAVPEADVAGAEEASEASLAAAAVVRRALAALRDTIDEHRDQLGQLDAVAGDGDHGIGMSRGATAAAEAADASEGGVRTVLGAAGAAFGDRAGGTSGILWGVLLDGIGQGLGNNEEVSAPRVAAAVQQAVDKLQTFSKAERGDKTMLDALFPFAESLSREAEGGQPLAAAWTTAAAAAVTAAEGTAELSPKIGRARPLAERSVGSPDPGAISLGLIVTAVGEVLTTSPQEEQEHHG